MRNHLKATTLGQCVAILLLTAASSVFPLLIDNSVTFANFFCLKDGIKVVVCTKNPLEGLIMANNKLHNPECVTNGTVAAADLSSLTVPTTEYCYKLDIMFGQNSCGVAYENYAYEVRIDVIFSKYCVRTKADKSFIYKCQLVESSMNVTNWIKPKTPPPTTTKPKTITVDQCKYTIADVWGNLATEAYPGNKLKHCIKCWSEFYEYFCLNVKNCYIVNSSGTKRVKTIDEWGCPTYYATTYKLMSQFSFDNTVLVGCAWGTFKLFWDDPAVHYECQVDIKFRNAWGACPRENCSSRKKRTYNEGDLINSFSMKQDIKVKTNK